MKIRQEKPKDYRQVEALIKKAFWNVNVPGCDEHYVAHCLRRHPDFIPELSLVLEEENEIIASVMYTKAKLVDETGKDMGILTFGPVAVAPEMQRKCYGKALLEHSFTMAAQMGFEAIVIFGHPCNYVNRGFQSCKKHGVSLEGGVFPTAMLVKELREGALSGHSWQYRESEAYQVDRTGFAEFDKGFPQYVPEVKPSQEEFYIYSHSRICG